jgi:phage shock protein PspC (stress-responsive transcriptional regulator)
MKGDSMNTVHVSMRQHGLVRPLQGRVLGGVVSGLGQRFGIDPWPARLLFALVLLAIPGSQLLIYPVLWILMPSQEAVASYTGPLHTGPLHTGPVTPTVPGV